MLQTLTLKNSITPILVTTIMISVANGDNSKFITEQDVFGDIPIVSVASRMSQSLDKTPASTTVIDRALIEASGAQTWLDIFRLVPGFQAYAVNGNRYGIAYHGFGREFPNHLEVMVDGRSIYSPAFSSTGWPALGLSINDVDHIEIVRGSSVPAHGSNAFLGAVNIITRTPVQDKGTRLIATIGDQDTREGSIIHNNQLGDLAFRTALHYRRNDGFPTVTNDPDGENGPLQDGTEQTSLNLRGIYTPNLQDVLDLQLGFTHSRPGWGDVDHPTEYTSTVFDTSHQSLKWNHTLPSGNELQLHVYHDRLEGENYENLGLASGLLSERLGFTVTPEMVPMLIGVADQPVVFGFKKIKTERYDIELEHHLQLNESLRATWGSAFRHEEVKAAGLFGDNDAHTLNSRRLFGHGEWLIAPEWTFNTGVMIEDNNLVDTIFSSRTALNYHLSPQHTFRIGIARGRRSPSLVEADEFNADFLEDLLIQAIRRSVDDIKEEKLTSYELGYIGYFMDGDLTTDIRLFREEIRDGLEVHHAPAPPGINILDPDDFFATRTNGLEADISGFEWQVRYRPAKGTLIAAQYSYRDVDSFYISRNTGTNVVTSDHNNRAPRHTASLVVSQQLTEQLTASVNTYHMSEADWRDGNSIDELTRIDAQLKYRFNVNRSHGSLSLIGQNLGEDYSEHGQNNVFETRVYLRFELELP
ncbi:MAG: TonB-dependent receptor [Pseudomonadales bacterium]|nr:TonB-dependent receptor [Pseudomonadales bacterium]MCP5172994.1 TonB-dependent receptor [Pseudomonadales bacterium]MCP5302467.1 TonB-dependent receptor [Pseudomonadales bacterium]